MWRVVVCDQETSKNEEAKARYRAVENTTTVGCNGRKTNKQTVYIHLSLLNHLRIIMSKYLLRVITSASFVHNK